MNKLSDNVECLEASNVLVVINLQKKCSGNAVNQNALPTTRLKFVLLDLRRLLKEVLQAMIE